MDITMSGTLQRNMASSLMYLRVCLAETSFARVNGPQVSHAIFSSVSSLKPALLILSMNG
jgi:hypothetical protein